MAPRRAGVAFLRPVGIGLYAALAIALSWLFFEGVEALGARRGWPFPFWIAAMILLVYRFPWPFFLMIGIALARVHGWPWPLAGLAALAAALLAFVVAGRLGLPLLFGRRPDRS